ncbi:F-box protein At2g40910-like isoform X2 [Raphanus sativus]|uniref:F-box protein At2g40910-like isoform X2 n=1 Tax=Raphanus sativus TaxID=3726 RepID=A0A9W3DF72_RAPSA|nr:F-box protein At2g40910-like isoform X2 [Raphanus sativus]
MNLRVNEMKNIGRKNLKQAASEQDFKLKQCQSIAQIMDTKGDNSSKLFKRKKRRSSRAYNLLVMGCFLGLPLRTRRRRRRYMSEIPLDLLVEILIRLPGKYLARFKCVSKQWSSLISSPYFCERLLTITQRKQHLYMCLVDKDGQRALLSMSPTSPDNTCFVVDQDLSIPGMGGYYLNGLHGLMCFSMRKRTCIYNPTTGQRLTLPKIKPDIIAEPDKLLNLKTEHWVFVLEAGGSWKKVVPSENYRPHAPFVPGQSISGSVVYYLAWHNMYTYAIVSFDVRSEEFTTIIAFVDDRYAIPAFEMRAELIKYGGKIAIFEYSYLRTEGTTTLRVLEDAEKKEWSTRSLVLQPCQMHLVQDIDLIVKGTTQDGKVILAPMDVHSGFYILSYDLQSNDLSKVETKGIPDHWFEKECWFDKECNFDLRLVNESSFIYLET